MKAPVKDRGRGAGAGEKAYKAVLREDGSSCARELQLRLRASGMVRRMKTDRRIMATLPPKFRQVLELPIQLTREIREELNSAEANFEAMDRNIRDMPVPVNEADLRASFSTEGFDVFQRMAQMQDGGKVDFEAMARIRANLAKLKAPTTASYLLDVLAASAEADRPQKIICFGHHRDALTRIIEIVEAEMPGAVVSYLGGASKRKRQEAVDRLQNDERTRLFVGSIGAASTGLTLTRADRVVFSELDWVPSQIMQAEDRAWRIGQVHNVLVQFLVIPDSLEVKLARSLVAKLDVLANAIGGSPRLRRSLEEIYRAEMGEEVEAADQLPAATGAGAARPGQLALFGAADP
jgi:SNF2 family DNA or RNA helicase